VRNHEYRASLELRKLYEVIPDESASRLRQIRLIDESGEDYLYPESYFVPVKLPQAVGVQCKNQIRQATARSGAASL
jgi:hypothetical protein